MVVFGAGLEAMAQTLRVELDKVAVLRLDKDANVVYVANPAIADVVVESPRLVFVLGRSPGETSLRILDSRGRDIVDSTIVVVPTEARTVTINRNETDSGAIELTFSCDPRCAEIRTPSSQRLRAAPVDSGAGDESGEGGASASAGAGQTAPAAP
ncbi:MAG: pilus assembly protein N-terminal domain-containing protein [Alphaproteobacteria bacterium]